MKKKFMITVIGVCIIGAAVSSCGKEEAEAITISIADYQDEYDIDTEIPVTVTIEPEDASVSDLTYEADPDGLDFSEDGIATGSTEGTYEVYVTSGDVKSNSLSINVVDITAREEAEAQRLAEEQAAKEAEEKRLAEEQAAKEAEEKRLAEEQAAKEAEEKRLAEEAAAAEAQRLAEEKAAKEAAEQKAAAEAAAAAENEAASSGGTGSAPAPAQPAAGADLVWVDDTAKRYHKKNGCGMDNAYQVTIDQAVAMGKTPCGRCYK